MDNDDDEERVVRRVTGPTSKTTKTTMPAAKTRRGGGFFCSRTKICTLILLLLLLPLFRLYREQFGGLWIQLVQPMEFKNEFGNDKQAIVWVTDLLTECGMHRLRHLVESAKTKNRDVWILHAHNLMNEYPRHSSKLVASRERMASINGLRILSAEPVKRRTGTVPNTTTPVMTTGPSIYLLEGIINEKSSPEKYDRTHQMRSFFKLIADYGYESGWYIDQDNFFTGDWSDFLDFQNQFSRVTLTGTGNNKNGGTNIYDIDLMFSTADDGALTSPFAVDNPSWQIARVSSRLAKHFYEESVKEQQLQFQPPSTQLQFQGAENSEPQQQQQLFLPQQQQQRHWKSFVQGNGYLQQIIFGGIHFSNYGTVGVGAGANVGQVVQIDPKQRYMYLAKSKLYYPISCQEFLPTKNDNTGGRRIMELVHSHYQYTGNYPFAETDENQSRKQVRNIFPPTDPTPIHLNNQYNDNNQIHQSITGREAVFWNTIVVTECEAQRLRHLVETAGPNRDVYVIHGHNTIADPTSSEVLLSEQLIQGIPNLQTIAQSELTLEPFDNAVSFTAQSTTLRAIVAKRYQYNWHIENDAFFTGNWNVLFDSVSSNNYNHFNTTAENQNAGNMDDDNNVQPYDVVYAHSVHRSPTHEWWKGHAGHMCFVDSIPCPKISGDAYSWPVIRFSYRFIYALLTEMEEGWVRGNYEAVLGAYLESRRFTSTVVPSTYIGHIELGGWGKWMDVTKHHLERLAESSSSSDARHAIKDHVYHPVNCAAYDESSSQMEALVRRQYPSSSSTPTSSSSFASSSFTTTTTEKGSVPQLETNINTNQIIQPTIDETNFAKTTATTTTSTLVTTTTPVTAATTSSTLPSTSTTVLMTTVTAPTTNTTAPMANAIAPTAIKTVPMTTFSSTTTPMTTTDTTTTVPIPTTINENKRKTREAIIWMTDTVLDCESHRVRHLVETAKTQSRDVWVLHAHFLMNMSYGHKEMYHSRQLMQSMNGLRVSPGRKEKQRIRRLSILHDIPIPKSSREEIDHAEHTYWFLEILVYHGYDYAYYVDHENFYTGDWGQFFDTLSYYNDDESDLLTISLADDDNNQKNSWSLARLSFRFGNELLKESQKAPGTGRLMDLDALINRHGFKNDHFKGLDLIRNPTQKKQSSDTLEPSKLYYPLSCSLYEKPDEMKALVNGQYHATGNFPFSEDTTKKDIRTVFPPVSPYEPNGKEAIFWTTRSVNHCQASRLRHLVETSNRDVYIIHSHHKLSPNSDEVKISEQLIRSIPGLKSMGQSKLYLDPFDSKVSGSSKSSTIHAMADLKYSYSWQIEDDNFFTGNWSYFFDETAKDKSDLLNTMVISSRDEYSEWWTGYAGHTCFVDGKWCASLSTKAYSWPAIRLSYRLAYALWTEMDEGWATGFHEAVMPAYIAARNGAFTASLVSSDVYGKVQLGGWGFMKDHSNQNLINVAEGPILSNHLYHPVKCKAYKDDEQRMNALLQNQCNFTSKYRY